MGSGYAIPPVIKMSDHRYVFFSWSRVESVCDKSRAYALDTCYRIMFLYFTMEWIVMPKAFVLMNAELGSEDSIVNELKKLEGVKEVYQVYGVYDIVAQVEANTMERVKETITWKLRKLNGVKSTLTMIVMD